MHSNPGTQAPRSIIDPARIRRVPLIAITSRSCQLVIILVDVSGSMAGAKAKMAQEALQELVRVLASQENKDGFFVLGIAFSDASREVVPVTKATAAEVPLLVTGSSTNIADGLVRAAQANELFLAKAKAEQSSRIPLKTVTILLTDGDYNSGGNPLGATNQVKTNSDLVVAAVEARPEKEAEMQAWATSPQHFVSGCRVETLRSFLASVAATITASYRAGQDASLPLAASLSGGSRSK